MFQSFQLFQQFQTFRMFQCFLLGSNWVKAFNESKRVVSLNDRNGWNGAQRCNGWNPSFQAIAIDDSPA
jgi:hypothetical protein